jgi:alanine dehydrogenase
VLLVRQADCFAGAGFHHDMVAPRGKFSHAGWSESKSVFVDLHFFRYTGAQCLHVVVIGAGVVGTNAPQMAFSLGARVTVHDKNVDRLRQLDLVFGNRISTACSNAQSIEDAVLDADVTIGGVLIPGVAAPKLITRDHVAKIKKGAVIVGVAVDQGGCFDTSRATTHPEPV